MEPYPASPNLPAQRASAPPHPSANHRVKTAPQIAQASAPQIVVRGDQPPPLTMRHSEQSREIEARPSAEPSRTSSSGNSSEDEEPYLGSFARSSFRNVSDSFDTTQMEDATTLEQLLALQASIHDTARCTKFSRRASACPINPKHYRSSTKVRCEHRVHVLACGLCQKNMWTLSSPPFRNFRSMPLPHAQEKRAHS